MNEKTKKKKPIFKKWWFWVIVVIFIAIFAMSGSDESKKEIASVDGQKTESSENAAKSDDSQEEATTDTTNTDTAKTEETSIEEQVLFEQDGIKITATEYVTDSIWGEGIKLLLENNSDKTVGIGCETLIVNDYMIDNLFTTTVAAGKKDNETLDLYSSELEAAGIENVGQIEIKFYLYDAETYMTTYTADMVTIQTSAYDEMDITPEDAGQELYNENGVRIVGKYVDEYSIWGSAILLYMEINSGKNIIVSCDELSVNGYMITSLLYSTINDGKMIIDDIALLSSDLEENGIENIEEVVLVFDILDAESYSTITSSDPISFTLN